MAALFESCRDDLRDYLDAIPISDGQAGAIYAIGGSLTGIEVFDSDMTFKKLAGKLLTSYALDAMEWKRFGEPPNADAVRTFVESVCVAARQPAARVGIGATVRLAANDLVGAALKVAAGYVHLAAFRRQAFDDRSSGQGLAEARISRSSARARRW
jgi:hypothetical protein